MSPLVYERFEVNARNHPERVAVTSGASTYSYGELNARANRFAHLLIAEGLGQGSIVGICLHPSPGLIVAILAVLKAGAAYAPLDTTYPKERLAQMRSQLGRMNTVVASPQTSKLLDSEDLRVLDIEQASEGTDLPSGNPSVGTRGTDHCYVIFTSGSTGIPKAAAVTHAGWYNLLAWLETEFQLDSRSSDMLISPLGFDISQRSIMAPLFMGAALHLLPTRNFDPIMATKLIGDLGVRTLHCAPSALYLMLEREATDGVHALRTLDFIFVGGEPLSAGRLERWRAKPRTGKLVNVYGVAECTDVSTFHILTDFEAYESSGVPIGTPIFNTDIHILNPDLSSVAAAEIVGEICISGVSVGAGYLNDPVLTQDRFIRCDGVESTLYRTGDLGRVRGTDGKIACVGRVDNQVKVRGMRLDLGDVETSLRASTRIEDAAVLADQTKGGGDAELVAFVIPTSPHDADRFPDERALRAEFLAILPAHMVPSRFIFVEEFPLSPNGKVDRKALATNVRVTA